MLNQNAMYIVIKDVRISFQELSPQFRQQSTEGKQHPHVVDEHFVKSELLFADDSLCESIYDKYLAKENQCPDMQKRENIPTKFNPFEQSMININDVIYPQTNEQQFRPISNLIIEQEDELDGSLENIFSLEESKTNSPSRILLPLQMFRNQEHIIQRQPHHNQEIVPNNMNRRPQDLQNLQRIHEFNNWQSEEIHQIQRNNEEAHQFRGHQMRNPDNNVRQNIFPRYNQQQFRVGHDQQPYFQPQRQYQPSPINNPNPYDMNRRVREIRSQRMRVYNEFHRPTQVHYNPFQRNVSNDMRYHEYRRGQQGRLDQNEVLMLTEIVFIGSKCRGWGEEDRKCSICLGDFETNEKVRFLPCLHRFHSNCVDPWLKQNSKCPLCKKDLKKLIQEMDRTSF